MTTKQVKLYVQSDSRYILNKLKNNQRYKQQNSCYQVNAGGLVVLHDALIVFSNRIYNTSLERLNIR